MSSSLDEASPSLVILALSVRMDGTRVGRHCSMSVACSRGSVGQARARIGSQERRSRKMSESYAFSVVLEPQEGGGFTVLVPALPEVVTGGDDEDEHATMLRSGSRRP